MMTKPDYSNKPALVKYYSEFYPDNVDFAEFLAERMEYFSDRFGDEHIEFFDMLWVEMKKRLNYKK